MSQDNFREQIKWALNTIDRTSKPAALILRKNIIEDYQRKIKSEGLMSRYEAIEKIVEVSSGKVIYISTNGFSSRELFAILVKKGIEDVSHPFYMVGSMGHALPIGLGVAMEHPDKKILVLDGDGAVLMHLGAMTSVGKDKPKNLIHVVLDNKAYGSTGTQPSLSEFVNFVKIAEGCGYNNVVSVNSLETLENEIGNAMKEKGPTFIHVRINREENKPSVRVSDKYSLQQIRDNFMNGIQSNNTK